VGPGIAKLRITVFGTGVAVGVAPGEASYPRSAPVRAEGHRAPLGRDVVRPSVTANADELMVTVADVRPGLLAIKVKLPAVRVARTKTRLMPASVKRK